jgi:tRNA1Val (adenine37-N6)-methyltransferase
LKTAAVLYLRDKDVTLDSIRDIKICQSKEGYRFSVDSLLLYDFVNLRKVSNIADLGTGSGIVGILLAKKYPDSRAILFEIQENLVRLAQNNLVINCIADRAEAVRCDLRLLPGSGLPGGKYDLVVSNPPFRVAKSGRINISEEKSIARHEIKLKLSELLKAASFLLRAKGRLCMIYHPGRLSELIRILREEDCEPKRLRFVFSNVLSEAKMVLVEAVKGGRPGLRVDRPFYIYGDDGSYSAEMEHIYNS